MNKKIKGVIFDLDGTLANTLPLCIQAFRKSIEPILHRPISDEEIIATFGPSEEGTIRSLIPEYYNQGVADYLQFYEILHEICPNPFDGIRELLTLLADKSVRVAMVTGKGVHSTAISLKKFDILHFFEIIETGSPYGPRKTEGIHAVLAQWNGIKKEEVLYIGDAPGDIEASRNAGIPVIAAAWADTADAEKLERLQPDGIFHHIPDFANWLKNRI